MKKIIGVLQPFDLKQTFYVYDNGNKLVAAQLKIDEIPETLFKWSKEYSVNQVDLIGPAQYNKGLKKKIENEELNKYNKNQLNINIVSKTKRR